MKFRIGPRVLPALLVSMSIDAPAAAGNPRDWIEWRPLRGPCAGGCATAIYGGWYVENPMTEIFLTQPETPFTWDYDGDYLIATAVARRIATLWRRVDVEPEIGIGQRFGEQAETELWGRSSFVIAGFPGTTGS